MISIVYRLTTMKYNSEHILHRVGITDQLSDQVKKNFYSLSIDE